MFVGALIAALGEVQILIQYVYYIYSYIQYTYSHDFWCWLLFGSVLGFGSVLVISCLQHFHGSTWTLPSLLSTRKLQAAIGMEIKSFEVAQMFLFFRVELVIEIHKENTHSDEKS